MKREQLSGPVRLVLATLLIMLGVLGIVLPILPGWLFIGMALFLLGVIERRHIKEARDWWRQHVRRKR